MPTPVKMPQLGETVVEGTVARWRKQPGEAVARQEPLLDITTEKIDTEVPAPADGVLLKILAAEGTTVQVGSIIAYIGDNEEENSLPDAPVVTAHEGVTAHKAVTAHEAESAEKSQTPSFPSSFPTDRTTGKATPAAKPAGRDFVSPVVARISAEHNIDLHEVEGTGRRGRITKKDLLAFIDAPQEQASATQEQASATQPQASVATTADELLLPLSSMRRAIAEHMTRSVRASPHVVTLFEADMTAVVRHRAANKEAYAQKGVRLTFTPYFVAAVAAALRQHPTVNSRWTDAGLALHQRIHIGIAAAVHDGLVVPVIRDADERSLQGLARNINDLSNRARQADLAPDELRAGTFTVTNHGVSGSLLGTPIINQPQAAILGIGRISKRAVVRTEPDASPMHDPLLPSAHDAIWIRPMCYLSLAFDHRILDGLGADRFLVDVVKRLETWSD